MGITPEMIELLEVKWQRARAAGIVDQPVTSASCHYEAPRVVRRKEINGREAVLTVMPIELTQFDGETAFAKTVRVELRKACGVQSLDAEFRELVLIQEAGVFVRMPRGKQRFQVPGEWQPFDLWKLVSGSKKDIKEVKSLGVSIRKQPCGSIA